MRKNLYKKKIAPKGSLENFMDVQKGIQLMRDEFFAFHVEYGNGYRAISDTFTENEKCGLQEIDFWGQMNPWIAIHKNSTYKKLIKFG